MLGSLGPVEVGVVLVVALLFFGPRRLPALGRSIGETIRELRSAGRALVESDAPPEQEQRARELARRGDR